MVQWAFLGGVVQQIGLALAIAGFAVTVGASLVRLLWIIRWRKLLAPTIVIGFYARAVATLGVMVMFTGMIAKGSLAWPWLIVVFVFGAPALALLLVRPPLGVGDSKKPS
jgi:hypothetical protein